MAVTIIIQIKGQMASEQVLQWMQQEVRLSKVINSFEQDFANGYHFGEILCQYGILDDISRFSKKTNKEAKVSNFYRVEAALRDLKIRFDAKLINNIMNEERGAALRLLYQIKRAIQLKEGPPADALEAKTETGLKRSLLDKVREQRQEQTNALASTIEYKTQGGKDVRSNKLKLQDLHLLQYDINQKLLFEKAKRDADAEASKIANAQQDQRQRNIKNLKDNQAFMKEWEAEGVENWKKNNQVRAENAARVKFFEDREVNIYKAKLEKELNMATLEMRRGLSEFEKNLQKLGIEQNVNMDDAIKRMEEKKGIPPGQIQNFSYAATMNKIKETKKQSDFAGKERERRRTKLMVDQQATQAQLDKQRQEDLLIQKLLNQQAEESRQAFIDHRLERCKQMQGEGRFAKAEAVAVKREAQMQAIDAKRIAEVKAGEAKRKQEIAKQRLEHAKIKKAKKAEKRKVNIEIASELIDLIMDVGNEAYDLIKGRENQKLTKEEWRDFMNIFKEGKRVSLRNVVKKHVDQTAAISDQNEIVFKENVTATEIMIQYHNEPALPEFYQFLCGTGQFDLAAIKPDLWREQLVKNCLGLQADYTQLQTNPELGALLEELHARHLKKASRHEQEEKPKVPTDFVLKLAVLGRAFAGKKTVAKQIQEQYGGPQNIKIFSMDEIIIEALEYVTPKKQDEAQAYESQKKAPAKKPAAKAEEVVHTDIFEGRDSTEYKRLANLIKSQYFPDFEGEFASKVDLINFVVDDKLLTDLFTERLKLEYEGKQKKQDLYQGCVREKEILHQLKDSEQTDQPVEVKKDDKAKKGAPAKQVKGNDDLLKEELEGIRRMDVNGWILVGFPRTLAQAKLLEKSLSGYEAKFDKPKAPMQVSQDAWGKITTPASLVPEDFNPQNEVIASAFDGVLFLQVGDDEVQRRAKNRKVDPQTNIVYHMEDSPPEESKDTKLVERLQPYKDEAGNPNRIATVNQRYNQAINLIHSFTEQFGLIDPRTQQCRVACNMKVKKADWANWRQKDAVKEAVMEKVRQIVEFKRELFQSERQRILDSIEEEFSRYRESHDSKLLGAKSDVVSQKPETRGEAKADDFRTADRSLLGVMSKTPDIIASQVSQEPVKDGKSSISQGGSISADLRSSKLLKRVYEINDHEKVLRWEQTVNTYYKEGVQCFNMMRLLRQRVFMSLNKTQNNFISFLERQSPMQKKINEFCESYNKFNEEFPQLRENTQTQEELQNRVELLSQSLWEIIKERNSQAVKERAKYMEGGWVFVEMSNLATYIARLIENEWLRFTTISAMVTGYVLNEDLDLQTLVKRLVERGIDPYLQGQPYGHSPILSEAVLALTGAITKLFNEQYFINLEHSALEIITREKDNLFMRINMLQVWAVLMLQEISAHSNKVFEVLDDWIVVSVKKENELSQRAVRELKDLVAEKAAYMDSVLLGDLDLTSQIDTISFEEGPPIYLQEYKPPCDLFDKRLPLDTLHSLYQLFKSNSVGGDLLDSQTFITLMFINLQANTLPRQWRQISFEKFLELASNFSAVPLSENNEGSKPLFRGKSMKITEERQYVNWKRIFTAIALNANPYPKTKDLQAYIIKLESLVDPETCLISEQQFIEVPAFFDPVESAILPKQKPPVGEDGQQNSTEDDEEEVADHERTKEIKRLLFKTFKIVNANGMRVSDFQGALEALFRFTNDKCLFEELFM